MAVENDSDNIPGAGWGQFAASIAVVTGAGSGMGRELAVQLAGAGAHLALSDIHLDTLTETVGLARAAAPGDITITAHVCDVSDENAVVAWRDAVMADHQTSHVNYVFNNAGIGGGGSFVTDDRDAWERTFNICWFGVYYSSRAFMPLLVAAEHGHLVNTSSVNGFWASIGPGRPHSAYSAAKFAVKGFTEALITDLRANAPHVKASVVMPGHIGTSIALNSVRVHGGEVDAGVHEVENAFRNTAPTTSAQASTIILDAVARGDWRILVGDDAVILDELVRANPEEAYEMSFVTTMLSAGALPGLIATLANNSDAS